MNNEIYLDNASSTIPCEACISAMDQALRHNYYNPSSRYKPALELSKEIYAVKDLVATICGTKDKNVFFLSCGTEANNFAILSQANKYRAGDKILYSSIEHPSVAEVCKSLHTKGICANEIPVLSNGLIDEEKFIEKLDGTVKLICVMHVNNEISSVNQLGKICELRDFYAPNASIHVDGVQGFLKVPFSFKMYNVQSYSISAHKIYGPKGLGLLVCNTNCQLTPFRFGGGQEFGYISGTENTASILGFAAAVHFVLGLKSYASHMQNLKITLLEELRAKLPNLKVLGPDPCNKAISAPHILNIALPPLRSEILINAMANENIYCSSGSACASMKQKVSKVLKEIGVNNQIAESSIRVSFAHYNTVDEIKTTADVIQTIYQKYSKFVRR